MAGEHEGQFVTLQRAVMVAEADPTVELWVAFQLSFKVGHADQNEADPGPVENV